MLTQEMAGKLASRMKLRWNLHMEVSQGAAAYWLEQLRKCSLTDDAQAEELFERWAGGWRAAQKPAPDAFFQWLRENTPRGREWKPSGDRCALCGDVGWMPMAVPLREDEGTPDWANNDFIPGVAWSSTRMAAVSVPCACSTGRRIQKPCAERKERFGRDRERMRLAWMDYFPTQKGSPVGVVHHFLRRCFEAYTKATEAIP